LIEANALPLSQTANIYSIVGFNVPLDTGHSGEDFTGHMT